MAVRIRLKKLGRKRRPFFRVCAMDSRTPRDGRVIEELGHYDPMVRETDARAILKSDRIDYWLSVGAQPSDKVKTLIKKYGTSGTHLEQQRAALERIAVTKPTAPPPVAVPRKEDEAPSADETPADETPAEGVPAVEDANAGAETGDAAEAESTGASAAGEKAEGDG